MKYCGLKSGDIIYCKENISGFISGDELKIVYAEFGKIKITDGERIIELESYKKLRKHFALDIKSLRRMKLKEINRK